MSIFPVTSAKALRLAARLQALRVREADLQEHFVRAGGPGGQNVNKVSTCVVLRHVPSRIEVKCQESRSQGLNRYLARCRLCEKLGALREGIASLEQQRREKVRRQKRRRSRRARQQMLANKRHQAEKKRSRQSPALD